MSTISRDRTRRHPSRCRIWLLEVKGAERNPRCRLVRLRRTNRDQVGRRMAARMTFRATEPPMTARSALGGLRPWLLGLGVLTVVISVGLLAISVVVIVGAH
jgi:hypothetical protein